MRIPVAICDTCGAMTALTHRGIADQAKRMETGDIVGQCAVFHETTCISEPCSGVVLFAGWMAIGFELPASRQEVDK